MASYLAGEKSAAVDERHAEGTAQQATDNATYQNGKPCRRERQGSGGMPEVGVFAEDHQGGNTCQYHRNDQGTAGPLLEGTTHFLDCKYDTCQRGIKGGRNSRGPASENQCMGDLATAKQAEIA